jgi:hypothetical protein
VESKLRIELAECFRVVRSGGSSMGEEGREEEGIIAVSIVTGPSRWRLW